MARKPAAAWARQSRRSRGRPTMEVSLPQDVFDALKARADQTGEPRSAIVERALRVALVMDLSPSSP